MIALSVRRSWRSLANHEIDAILVTELSRWGRSTQDLARPLMTCTAGRSACLRNMA